MSKWWRGGSHHPPLLFWGQKLVAVTVTERRGRHHFRSALSSHITWQQAPHASPPLKSAPLNAVVWTPNPAWKVLSQPQAPPIQDIEYFNLGSVGIGTQTGFETYIIYFNQFSIVKEKDKYLCDVKVKNYTSALQESTVVHNVPIPLLPKMDPFYMLQQR